MSDSKNNCIIDIENDKKKKKNCSFRFQNLDIQQIKFLEIS